MQPGGADGGRTVRWLALLLAVVTAVGAAGCGSPAPGAAGGATTAGTASTAATTAGGPGSDLGSSTTAGPTSTTAATGSSATAPVPGQGTAAVQGASDPTTTTALTRPVDPRLAGLPPGRGARIAIVIDDVGGPDTYLADYLALRQPVTFSIIPFAAAARGDDERIHAAGREVMLHLPLANHRNHGDGATRLSGTESPAQVEAFVQAALARVPHAVGANNHEGSYGSTQPTLMRALLTSLRAHGLWFMDSVTSQRTVGFALEAETGHPPRINNVFLDHLESDDDSLQALVHLARVAAANGDAVGIGHVHHPYLARVLAAHGAELEALGYRFLPLSQVTDGLADGLDSGVRAGL